MVTNIHIGRWSLWQFLGLDPVHSLEMTSSINHSASSWHGTAFLGVPQPEAVVLLGCACKVTTWEVVDVGRWTPVVLVVVVSSGVNSVDVDAV